MDNKFTRKFGLLSVYFEFSIHCFHIKTIQEILHHALCPKLLNLAQIFVRPLSIEPIRQSLSWSTSTKNSMAAGEYFLQTVQLKKFRISFLWASVSHTVKISAKNCKRSLVRQKMPRKRLEKQSDGH